MDCSNGPIQLMMTPTCQDSMSPSTPAHLPLPWALLLPVHHITLRTTLRLPRSEAPLATTCQDRLPRLFKSSTAGTISFVRRKVRAAIHAYSKTAGICSSSSDHLDALRRAAANIAAENSDAAAAQRRKELALAAERYRDQREIMEAEWRLKRQERRLQAEQDSQRRREIERQMAHDREMRQRLLRAKDERDRTARMLHEERRRTRQQQRSKMRVEEGKRVLHTTFSAGSDS